MRFSFILIILFHCAHSLLGQTNKNEFLKLEEDFFRLVWSDHDSMKFVLLRMEEIAKEAPSNEFLAKTKNARGTYYYSTSAYNEALQNYNEAYEFAIQWKDNIYIGKTINNIAACHTELEDYSRAEYYYRMALPYFEIEKNEFWIRNINYNLANIYLRMEKYNEAYAIYAALEIEYLDNENTIEAGYCNMGKGDALHNQEKYLEAITNYNLAINRIDTTNDGYTFALALQNRAFSLIELDRDDEAQQAIYKSLWLAEKNKYTKIKLTNVELLASLYKKQNRLDSANFYLQKAIDLKGDVFDETKQEEFAQIETKFKTKLKEDEIIAQQKMIREKNMLIWLLAFILLIIVALILILVFTYIKLRKNKQKLVTALDEKENLLREIHHRVKNNLQVVSSLLNMHVRKVKDPASKKILEEGSERLMAMSIIHKNLYPDSNLKTISLDGYLFTLTHQLFENYQLNYSNVSLETQLEKITVDIDILIPIGLIVNELISNSMKHAFSEDSNARIIVRLRKEDAKHISLEIADNGIGIDLESYSLKNESIGMKLITIFCEKIKSKLSVINESGTIVKLIIPHKE